MHNCISFLISWNLLLLQGGIADPSYEVVYGWKEIDFHFESPEIRSQYLASGQFIPENCGISGVKLYGDKIYLTAPRFRPGVPSSLNYVDNTNSGQDPGNAPNGPPLRPFPSLAANEPGLCSAFQHVQSMEIDQYGRMWILDVGRIYLLDANRTAEDDRCPPKLVIMDLRSGKVEASYTFPNSVASYNSSFLQEIVVACHSRRTCTAYIADVVDAKIVVYSLLENNSWFVNHSSMLATPDGIDITILGKTYPFQYNIDGIAVSPASRDFDRLYYSALGGFNLYSVETAVLKTSSNGATLADSQVRLEGIKSSQSDGFGMDARGILNFGLVEQNAVAEHNTSNTATGGALEEDIIAQNDVDLQWPDSFGFDNTGLLYFTTDRLQLYPTAAYNWSEINFRVNRLFTGTQNYMRRGKGLGAGERLLVNCLKEQPSWLVEICRPLVLEACSYRSIQDGEDYASCLYDLNNKYFS